jgi:hypothetical protein
MAEDGALGAEDGIHHLNGHVGRRRSGAGGARIRRG